MYPFLVRWYLSVRISTPEGQKLSGHLLSIRNYFADKIKEKFKNGLYPDINMKMFVNMDENAVFFESKLKSSVYPRVSKNVPIRCSGYNNKLMTICVSVAGDETQLPLFVIFKGVTGGRVK